MRLPIVVLLALELAGPAAAGQKKLQLKDLPAAVQAAVREEETKGATVRNVAAETAAGHVRGVIMNAKPPRTGVGCNA